MKISTGKFPVTLFTAAAILSLSLVVNLPGLAITPMLGSLAEIFPKTTQIEKQLLTVLPNLLIIPFVLLSGKLSLSNHKIAVVCIGLVIYAASGVAYLFASSMVQLIIISCLVGIGAGLIIPFSTGFIADVYAGKYCMRQMGLQSGISNMTLVAATFAVGWLSQGNWHLPFLVYLIPIIPLAMTFGLKGIPTKDLLNPRDPVSVPVQTDIDSAQQQVDLTIHRVDETREIISQTEDGNFTTTPADIADKADAATTAFPAETIYHGFYLKRIITVFISYFFIGYATLVISYYCPFLVEKKDWSAELTSTITSLYFLFIFLPGFFLPQIVRMLRGGTFVISAAMMTAGLAIFAFFQQPWAMCIGSSLCGLGYGICQPLIYDKASRTVESPRLATLALALVLSANYIAVVLTPFIIDSLRSILHAQHFTGFSFYLNFVLMAVFLIIAFFSRKSFAFGVPSDYYKK